MFVILYIALPQRAEQVTEAITNNPGSIHNFLIGFRENNWGMEKKRAFRALIFKLFYLFISEIFLFYHIGWKWIRNWNATCISSRWMKEEKQGETEIWEGKSKKLVLVVSLDSNFIFCFVLFSNAIFLFFFIFVGNSEGWFSLVMVCKLNKKLLFWTEQTFLLLRLIQLDCSRCWVLIFGGRIERAYSFVAW